MEFIDLAAQQERIRDGMMARIAAVMAHGRYILGPEVEELEKALAAFCGAGHCVTCANGTDALQIALMAMEVGPGDAVMVPSFTFAASAEVVALVGATPVFVDIDLDTYTMSAGSLARAITRARGEGLAPKVVMPVDLFGMPADYDTLGGLAAAEGLRMLADSAQGWGARSGNRMTGTLAEITATSFFPAKPLGCYGDGGALFTDDAEQAEVMRSLRVHGKGTDKYDNIRIGLNSRLDTLQAAILLEKISIYEEEIATRDRLAARYSEALARSAFATPGVPDGLSSVWAQYTIRAPDEATRDAARAALQAEGIPTVIYYPKPLHLQTAYARFPTDPAGLAASEDAARTVFSLPSGPYLNPADQDRVIAALLRL